MDIYLEVQNDSDGVVTFGTVSIAANSTANIVASLDSDAVVAAEANNGAIRLLNLTANDIAGVSSINSSLTINSAYRL